MNTARNSGILGAAQAKLAGALPVPNESGISKALAKISSPTRDVLGGFHFGDRVSAVPADVPKAYGLQDQV